MTDPTQRIILGLNNETFISLRPSQRQILFEKVEVLDYKIKGLLTADLQEIRALCDCIETRVLAALADRFPTLINELHAQEIKERA